MALIGLCEDDPGIRRVVREALAEDGHEVLLAHSGAEALRRFTPDLDLRAIVLDIGLPDSDGRDVCQALGAAGVTAPVLFLTARGGLHEVVAGFGAGGDDYLTKPFEPAELQVRVAALVRRAPHSSAGPTGLRLDPGRFTLRSSTAEVAVTPTEFRLIALLVANPGEVVRRRRLTAAGWPHGAIVHANTLDAYMLRARRRLEQVDPAKRIETVRGVGYVLR